MSCPECRAVGWLLNDHHAGNGPSDPKQPLSLDLIPCIYPDCDAPKRGNGEPRAIATLGIRGQFREVVRLRDGSITALTHFVKAIYR